MVDKGRVRLLVEALRSGEYVQGTDRLEVQCPDGTVKHCCLGVACRMAMANGLAVKVVEQGGETLPDGRMPTTFDRDDALPPDGVREWYGFEFADPQLHIGDGDTVLASIANDARMMSFADIADAFERTYLEGESTDGQ